MDDHDIMMIDMVRESLMNNYNITREYANELIEQSTFLGMLEDCPSYVCHYEPEYWAKRIVDLHLRIYGTI